MARTDDRASGLHDRASADGRQPHARPALTAAHEPDPLDDVLRAVKLTGALFFLVEATDPWGVAVPAGEAIAPIILPRAQHVVSYHILLEGSAWATTTGSAPTRLDAGDVLVLPHANAYDMLTALDQPPEFDHAASLEFFREMAAGRLPFVVQEGGGGAQRLRLVCGFLGCDARPFNPLLAQLPASLRIRRRAGAAPDLLDRLIDLTLEHAQVERRGGEAIQLRLSELIFVEAVRRHLEGLPSGQTGWLAGLRDPPVARALRLLHAEPARAWSVQELAARAGLSRAVLADRFARLVGRAPIQYLTLWRMQLAARLLVDGQMKVAAVAHEVGYESEAAFSRAFKKVAGVGPAAWRASRSRRDHSV